MDKVQQGKVMGLRFRKSIKIAPGIRLSASHRGLGVRVGGRGGGISFSPSGTRASVSLPGTGLSWSEKIEPGYGSRSRRQVPAAITQQIELALRIVVDDETGEVTLLDASRNEPLSSELLQQVKKQQGDALRERLQAMVDQINTMRDELKQLHAAMPAPEAFDFVPAPFNIPRPEMATLPNKKLMHYIWPPAEQRRRAEIKQLQALHCMAQDEWEAAFQTFNEHQEEQKELQTMARNGDIASMELLLGNVLSKLEWPYETLIAWEFLSPSHLLIDIDFPEIEMLPARRATLAARGLKINLRKLAVRDLDELYIQHVSSIGMKLAGECFHLLPGLNHITLSGYSQRLDRTTGHERNDYLYSVRLTRDQWVTLNFQAPRYIDAYACLGGFEIRRDVLASWKMKPIQPFQT